MKKCCVLHSMAVGSMLITWRWAQCKHASNCDETHSSMSSSCGVAGAGAFDELEATLPALLLAEAGATAPRICKTATKSLSLNWRARFFNRERRFSALRRSFVSFFF